MSIVLTEDLSASVYSYTAGVSWKSLDKNCGVFFPILNKFSMLGVYACPLLVQHCSTRRFMSEFTLKTPHCVSCTVICGCVLSSNRVQLQEELILGCISSDGDSTFERWVVVSATTRIYVPHPLQVVSWKLPDPAPGSTSDGVASDRAGEGQ